MVATSLTDRFHASRFGERRGPLSDDFARLDYQPRAVARCANVW
jgi:hypothetical protein